jgi:hypothetical protein
MNMITVEGLNRASRKAFWNPRIFGSFAARGRQVILQESSIFGFRAQGGYSCDRGAQDRS